MSEFHHECGVAAIYHLPNQLVSDLYPKTEDQASTNVARYAKQEATFCASNSFSDLIMGWI